MDKNIIPFDYGDHLIRVVRDETGEPWWVAKDICKVLEIQNSRDAVKKLKDDEKGVDKIYTLKGEQNAITVNESGLYRLIFRSNKPEAEKFREWIFKDVLPSIRKTGSYTLPGSDPGGLLLDGATKKAGNMYFPMAKLVESADKYLEGKAALTALNYFTGMPVDDLIEELETKKLNRNIGSFGWLRHAVEDFLAEECEFSDEYQVQATEIYKAFCSWNKNQGIMKVVTQKKFGAVLSAGFDKVKNGTVRYVGLRLSMKSS